MSGKPLFVINPELNREALATVFARDRRVQIRNVLTSDTADTIHAILARGTPWGLAWNAGEQPADIRHDQLAQLPAAQRQTIAHSIGQAANAGRYAFAYHRYPMVDAYLQRWSPDSPQDLLLEHINGTPLLELVREITGFDDLIRADAQATLFAPGQFLGLHSDSHVQDGWRVAYVLNFTRNWREDWGGYLLFYDEDGDVVAGYKPRFNALNLFAVPQAHSVTYVPPFSPLGRLAVTGWFRNK